MPTKKRPPDPALKDFVCLNPFQMLELHDRFEAYPCCPDWLPVNVGQGPDAPLMDVWNSEAMQQIRRSIHNGDFSFCLKKNCAKIQGGRLPRRDNVPPEFADCFAGKKEILDHPPLEIALCYDPSCNLACPSCRTRKIQLVHGSEFEDRLRYTERIMEFVREKARDYPILLRVTGSGDPFASKIFRHLLEGLDGPSLPKLSISIQTNGVMLTPKIWAGLERIRDNISLISISIDAAREETYARLRRFGHWEQLLANISFLALMRREGLHRFDLSFNFVVQRANYAEMGDFVRLARSFAGPPISVFFLLMKNWGQAWIRDYDSHCVWREAHPEHSKFQDALRDQDLADPHVYLDELMPYRRRALGH